MKHLLDIMPLETFPIIAWVIGTIILVILLIVIIEIINSKGRSLKQPKDLSLRSLGIEVFGSYNNFLIWYNRPNPLLGGIKPSKASDEEVRNLLHKIEWGITV